MVVCMGEDSWAQQALAFELLGTVLDLTGGVDGGELMRVGRGWGMRWDMNVLACLLGLHFFFSFLLHHSCKFVVLSRSICLHSHGFVVKRGDRAKSLWG